MGYFDNSPENCKIALRRVIMRRFACKNSRKEEFKFYNFTSPFYNNFTGEELA